MIFFLALTCFLFVFSGIPTHVYQYGTCVLAACPAIILAQVTAMFIILPVFGKANKVSKINLPCKNLSIRPLCRSVLHVMSQKARLDLIRRGHDSSLGELPWKCRFTKYIKKVLFHREMSITFHVNQICNFGKAMGSEAKWNKGFLWIYTLRRFKDFLNQIKFKWTLRTTLRHPYSIKKLKSGQRVDWNFLDKCKLIYQFLRFMKTLFCLNNIYM